MSNTKPLGSNQTLKTVFNESKEALNVFSEVYGTTGIITDFSGSASTVDTIIMPANANRKFLLLHNLSGAINMWYRFDGVAAANSAGSIQISTKDIIIYQGTFIPTGALHLIAGSGTPTYTALEGV